MTSAAIHVLTGTRRPVSVVIGGSRGIGAEVASLLSRHNATILTYHHHAARAARLVESVNADAAKPLRCSALQLDLADAHSRANFARSLRDAGCVLDHLVISASGGLERDADDDYAIRLNAQGPAALVDALLPILRPGSLIAYLTSHEAHFFDPEMVYPPYRKVAESKKAGESALLAQADRLAAAGVQLNIVSADLVADSTTAKLLDMGGHGIVAFRRQMAGRLPTSREVAAEVVRLCTAGAAAHCSTSYVGVPDAFYAERGSGMMHFDWAQAREMHLQLKAQERIRLPMPTKLVPIARADRFVGIDIGGTKTAIARIDDDGIAITRSPTPAGLDQQAMGNWLGQLLAGLGDGQQIMLSVPGIVNNGQVAACDVVPGLSGLRAETLGPAVSLTNDAVASLVGARVLAAAQGTCLLIAAGTGIGGAFAPGDASDAILTMEPGYTPVSVRNDAVPLRLDDVASGQAVCAELGCELGDLQRLLVKGDLHAVAVCRKAGTILGRAIGGWINLLAPPRILVVGGLADAAPYWDGVQRGVGLTRMPELAATCLVQRVEYGAHAGVIGALAMAAGQSDPSLAQSLHARHLRVVGLA